jgi:hypothetical protein
VRKPDLIIGPRDNPQTLRWHIFRWRGWQFSLHKWLRSDDDRALHDHSGHNLSIILTGGYWEVLREWREYFTGTGIGAEWTHHGDGEWWRLRTVFRWPLVPYYRRADVPHRIVLPSDGKPVWSLWLRWPPIREWGFHCPKGWRHWKEYVAERDYSTPGSVSSVGPGCD